MTWHREIDYHGSRSYGADGPKARRFRAIAAWLANLTGRKSPNPGDPRTRALPARPQTSLSLFGANSPAPAQRPADCPFPLKPGQFDRRDWRLLP
jgi:hypothetical protein